MSTSLEKNFRSSANLIHFDAGAAGELKLCDLTTTLSVPQGTFLPDPRISIIFPERSGGFEEKPLKMTIRNAHPLIQRLTNGYPFAPVKVDIYEYFYDEVGSATDSTLHVFSGKLSKATKNADGKEDVVKMEAKSEKARLNFSLGISCNVQCSWTFGDNNCQATVTSMANTVDTIDGTIITVGTTPVFTAGLFKKGYIERDGIRILIRDWTSGVTFQLAKFCPPDWLGQAVTLYAGCDRFIETCIGTHNNQERFGGLGLQMTAYNPTAEEP